MIFTIIIPSILSATGCILYFHTAKNERKTLGYKTSFSTKNNRIWYEANRFYGSLMILNGVIFSLFSIIIIYLENIDKNLKIKMCISVLIILLSTAAFYTEVHLRTRFDTNGNKKNIR